MSTDKPNMPNITISNGVVHVKVYSFELNNVVYTGTKTISNENHPPCWYPEANLLVLESDSNRWVNCLGQWEEPCEKFSGKYNLCVSPELISDEVASGEEVHSEKLYVLSGMIQAQECCEIRFMDEGICLFIRVCDPILQAEASARMERIINGEDVDSDEEN